MEKSGLGGKEGDMVVNLFLSTRKRCQSLKKGRSVSTRAKRVGCSHLERRRAYGVVDTDRRFPLQQGERE